MAHNSVFVASPPRGGYGQYNIIREVLGLRGRTCVPFYTLVVRDVANSSAGGVQMDYHGLNRKNRRTFSRDKYSVRNSYSYNITMSISHRKNHNTLD